MSILGLGFKNIFYSPLKKMSSSDLFDSIFIPVNSHTKRNLPVSVWAAKSAGTCDPDRASKQPQGEPTHTHTWKEVKP